MNKGMNALTKQLDEWETPAWLYDALDHEFAFNLDAAATAQNAKCKHYLSRDGENALTTEWQQGTRPVRAFCNPPYSQCDAFVTKALESHVALVVLLLPVRTDSDWFNTLARMPEDRVQLRWLRKRVAFCVNGVAMGSPRFASLIAVVRR